MLKKSLLTIAFLSTAILVSGCNAGNNSENNAAEDAEQVDYIVTTEIPTKTAEGITDKAVGFVKIAPHFDPSNISTEVDSNKWFKKGLGSYIPAVDNGKILEVINTDKDFVAYVGNIDSEGFQNYFKKLAANHFVFPDPVDSWENFNMYSNVYAVNLRFSQDGPNVMTVRARLLTPEEKAKYAKSEESAPAEKEVSDKE